MTRSNADMQEAYINALEIEFARIQEDLGTVRTLYIGGGTPTQLSFAQLERVLRLVECKGEITIEANPEDVTKELVSHLKNLGVNRLSIGIQSLDASSLTLLGRGAGPSQSMQAVHTAFDGGIENISVDLMVDIPSQTIESLEKTLSGIESLPISHLSLYNMTIEPGTAFHRKRSTLELPSDENSLAMYEHTIESIEKMGLKRYEISAFAKQGLEAVHNVGYWTGVPFYGLGPSAYSFIDGKRFQNIPNIRKYIDRLARNESPVDFMEELPYPRNLRELFVIRLRLLGGAPLPDCEIPDHPELTIEDGWARLTDRGLLFYETVASELI